MMQTQATVLDNQSRFEKMLDGQNAKLRKVYEKVLGKKEDGYGPF